MRVVSPIESDDALVTTAFSVAISGDSGKGQPMGPLLRMGRCAASQVETRSRPEGRPCSEVRLSRDWLANVSPVK